MKKILTLLLALIMMFTLCACGNAKSTALEYIPDSATEAYMLKFDKNYDFSGTCDEVPNRGIIVLYPAAWGDNYFVVICNANGKEIRTLDNNTIKEHAENITATGSHLNARGDLSFITGCMKSCYNAALEGQGGEVITNQWHVFTEEELAAP